MRGSPFGFQDFRGGVNYIDSPYTLTRGEARDVLNVVSSPRGAVKKRAGSIAFASPKVATFPALAVTDYLKRANENPLKKDGKGNEAAWETFLNESTGEIT